MASRRAGLDDELKGLYQAPLGEFTAVRNALAKELVKAGKKKEADEVKALPKPTPSAWAVNQLFARESGKMDRLLGAGKRARVAQREAVEGAGAARLREAMAAVRDLAEELRQRAAAILAEDGRAPSRAMTDRVATNLQALAFSPASEEEASRGWLSHDLDPPGFEVFTGLKVPARVVNIESRRRPAEPEKKPAPKSEEKPAAKASTSEEAAERRLRAEQEKREAAERARREREAEKLRERVTRAEERVERAATEEDFLRRKAEQSEKAAEDARRRAEEAEEEAAEARRRAERAAEALARAKEALAEAREAGKAAR